MEGSLRRRVSNNRRGSTDSTGRCGSGSGTAAADSSSCGGVDRQSAERDNGDRQRMVCGTGDWQSICVMGDAGPEAQLGSLRIAATGVARQADAAELTGSLSQFIRSDPACGQWQSLH